VVTWRIAMGSLIATSPSLYSNTGCAGGVRIYACFALGCSNSLECYEPGDNTWRRVGVYVIALGEYTLKGFAVIALGESVYVIGGRLCRRERGRRAPTGVAPLLVPRFDFACAPCRGSARCPAAEVYDAVKDQWSAIPDMSTLRYKCIGVAWLGSFHVAGGFTESTLNTMLQSSSALGGGIPLREGDVGDHPGNVAARRAAQPWQTVCSSLGTASTAGRATSRSTAASLISGASWITPLCRIFHCSLACHRQRSGSTSP
jgi:hypothetical protein